MIITATLWMLAHALTKPVLEKKEKYHRFSSFL